jgi:hypothetical protein
VAANFLFIAGVVNQGKSVVQSFEAVPSEDSCSAQECILVGNPLRPAKIADANPAALPRTTASFMPAIVSTPVAKRIFGKD